MTRGTFIGLADLARLLEAEPDAFRDISESELVVPQAAQLGFSVRQQERKVLSIESDGETQSLKRVPDSPAYTPDPQLPRIPETYFWIAVTFQEREVITERFKPQLAAVPVTWNGGAKLDKPTLKPLSSQRILKPQLRELLAPLAFGNAIDVPRMVNRVARGKPLRDPPCRERRRWPANVLVLLDRTAHLAPFFADQYQILDMLEETAHSMTVRFEELTIGDLRTNIEGWLEDLKIDSDDTVLLLSDLGSLSNMRAQATLHWAALGRKLRARGVRNVGLTPGPAGLIEAGARGTWQIQAWDTAVRLAKTDREIRDDAIEYLLTLSAHAKRIQTGLLRDLRLQFAADFDAGIEAEFWDHADLRNAGALYAEFDPRKAKIRQAAFDRLSFEERKKASNIMKCWHQDLPPGVIFQEFVSLGEGTASKEEFEAAQRYFSDLAARYDSKRAFSIEAWLVRAITEDTQSLLKREDIEHLILAAYANDPTFPLPEGMDPSKLGLRPNTEGPIQLMQAGGKLRIFPAQADEPPANGSPLCTLPSGNGLLQIIPEEGEVTASLWQDGAAPSWAADWGADEFGRWVSFEVQDNDGETITQRLRWMPPGTFAMGSPEDEADRYSDEGPQHDVTFAQGFWMFETAVTQALYEAVMGNNLSNFQGVRLPVEKVSWNEAKEFIERLNARLPGLDLRLPSEAEWEYACRAGTGTHYSFGDTIAKEQVNFDGNVGQTVEVGSLPPNSWGLFEMHGNVDEWCEDTFQGSYESAPVDGSAWIDADAESAADRVIRGGSWFNFARNARSAYRFGVEPSRRNDNLGFRCARGPARVQPASGGQQGQAASAWRERSGARQTMQAPAAVGLSLNGTTAKPTPRTDRLRARTDRAEIILEKMAQPKWAQTLGRDRFGLYAEIEIEDVRQQLRWIPPGTFMMGSPDDELGRWEGEGPQRLVQISEGYWLFTTPVTQALYEAVTGNNPSEYKSPDRPVEQVSFDNAAEFLEQINKRMPGLDLRLPSEAQWEYACRAGTATATYAGRMEILGERNAPVLDDIAWYGGNSGVDFDLADGYDSSDWKEKQYDFGKTGTRKVGLKRPNALGLYDMLGNVLEWCEDHWHDSYKDAPVDGSAWIDADADSAADRVVRGGSWYDFARNARSAGRVGVVPSSRDNDLGFRCARGRDK
ncbi:MAG: formylglycine-generating enzyme family protein [Pseudomonadota bacterium]